MDPITGSTNSFFGASVIPAIIMRDSDGALLGDLTQSELEAVDRVKDQFQSEAELRDFVKGLRSK